MTTDRDIEQLLRKLSEDWSKNASILDDVMRRLRESGPRAEGFRPLGPGNLPGPLDEREFGPQSAQDIHRDSKPNAPLVPGDQLQGSASKLLLPSPLEGVGPGVRGPTTGRSRRIGTLAAAALVLALLATWFYFAGQPNSLSAQVIRAMDRAKSLNVVSYGREVGPHGEDRGLKKAGESWFMADVGFRYDWANEIRLGNNTSFWRFNRRTKTAFRSASGDIRKLLDEWFDVHKFAANMQRDYVREPMADVTVKKEPLKAYRLIPSPNLADPGLKDGSHRMLALLDSHSRIARVEIQKQQKGTWQSVSVQEWSYDVPIDAKLFEPNFGDGVKVVDSDRAFDNLVDLNQARHVEEREGLIYAVHRIERFEGGGLLVMSSVRGNEQTLNQFPLQRRMIQFGLYYVDGPGMNCGFGQMPEGCFRIPLAFASHGGIDLQWWIQVPRMNPPNFFDIPPDAAWIVADMLPSSQFGNAYGKAHGGAIPHIKWKLPLVVGTPPKLPTLTEIATSVYADAAALGAVPEYFLSLDLGIDDSGPQPMGRRGSLDDTTPAQFAEAVERHVRWWFHQDVEFQLNLPKNRIPMWQGAIGLSWLPGVGDAELVRLKGATGIKELFLRGTQITNDGLASLAGLTELTDLDLSETSITDAGLTHLTGLRKLKRLQLKNTPVTNRGIERLKAAIPMLKVER